MRSTNRKNKKAFIILILTLLLVFSVLAGTIAWLTRTSSVSNTFTVGSFETPSTSPKDPSVTINIDGNIYEPSWDKNATHKLIPSVSFDKDPYVGIGTGSEDAVVYVYVENNFSNKVYFNINAGWEAVSATEGFKDGTYTSGLFKYTAGLSGAESSDVWTEEPLFSKVFTDETSTKSDFTPEETKESVIKVSSFLHQAKDSKGDPIPTATIEAAAKAAFNI